MTGSLSTLCKDGFSGIIVPESNVDGVLFMNKFGLIEVILPSVFANHLAKNEGELVLFCLLSSETSLGLRHSDLNSSSIIPLTFT